MRTLTLGDIETRYGFEALDYLDRQAELPVVTMDAPTAQGDVIVIPDTRKAATTEIPRQGVVVATGQGGHHHTLTPGGFFDRAGDRFGSLVIGTLTVPAGGEVVLTHEEHGGLVIQEGTYRLGGQREFAGEWQRVAD